MRQRQIENTRLFEQVRFALKHSIVAMGALLRNWHNLQLQAGNELVGPVAPTLALFHLRMTAGNLSGVAAFPDHAALSSG